MSSVEVETHLESFIEILSTFPSELKRNLNLLSDIDRSCSLLAEEAIQMQKSYVDEIEEKIRKVYGGISNNNDDNKLTFIPTTEELMSHVHDPEKLSRIESLQSDSLQLADEKIEIAKQNYNMVYNLNQKLDNLILKTKIQVEKNGTNIDHKNVSLTSADSSITVRTNKRAPKPNDLAAVNLIPGSPDWILAKVLAHDAASGQFTLSDEDVESNKVFNLPASSVIILERMKNLKIGDNVFAVYPDTTSFYQGTIAQLPRKSGNLTYVAVTFLDDEDAYGQTHDKIVQLIHVMAPPLKIL